MRRALCRMGSLFGVVPNHVLVDGRPFRTLEIAHTAIVDGDDCCYTIACASILAKVTRDRLMHSLAERHPHYLWEKNVGYSTRAHFQGMAAHGVTPHHRRSFLPVSQLSLDLSRGHELDAAALAALIEQQPADDEGLAGQH
jgi:ribonuclease HII